MAGGHVGGRGAAPIKRFAPGDGVEGPAAFGGGTYGATHPKGGRQQWPPAIVGTLI
jgi:hypothetical protein